MSIASKPLASSADDDQTECVDWKLPLAFVKKRHLEVIEGVEEITQTWRMKERVSFLPGSVSNNVNCFR